MRKLICFGILVLSTFVTLAAQDNRGTTLMMTEKGLGPITAATPFDLSEIARLLPTLRVIQGVASSEGIEFPTIRVMAGQVQLFIISPEEGNRRIASIVVSNGRVGHVGKGKVAHFFPPYTVTRFHRGVSWDLRKNQAT